MTKDVRHKFISRFCFSDGSVVCNGTALPLTRCDREEADTRITVHVTDVLEREAKDILVQTVHTDVIVILIGQFHRVLVLYPNDQIWVAFETGKQFRYGYINTVTTSRGLPPSPASPGFNVASTLSGKSKRPAWAWNVHSEALLLVDDPYEQLNLLSPHFLSLERFIALLYDETSVLASVNEARRKLFNKNNNTGILPLTRYTSENLLLIEHIFIQY